MKEFKYEVVEELGVLKQGKAMALKANIISYNGEEPKLDIRWWTYNEAGEPKMSKGVALAKSEYEKLLKILEELHERDV